MKLPVEIYEVADVRKIDHAAIHEGGISGYTLMERAGKAAYDIARACYPDAQCWQVVCGSGNNGGDAYVVARLAAKQGISVSVIAVGSPKKLSGDAATAYLDYLASGGEVIQGADKLDDSSDLVIDGLLGSGLKRKVEGVYAAIIKSMNAHGAPVLSLDMPSGLNGDNGKIMGAAVVANITVTFVALKTGLFIDSGPELVGDLMFDDLDVPDKFRQYQVPVFRRVNKTIVQKVLRPRDRGAHKGNFGHILVIGGAPGMSGAVRLCGEAALRSGAGLVSIATHPSHSEEIVSERPELMCHGVECADQLDPLLQKATVVAMGPGLGMSLWSRQLFEKAVASGLPMVVDADALNLLAKTDIKNKEWILTPHPGEAARLLGISSKDIQFNRLNSILNLQERFSGIIVLKGAGTLISSNDGRPWICSAGNPGMASPGMGDVLTGIIAALWGQKNDAEMAAIVGVQVHGLAGDKAALRGERGLVASDLIAEIRHWVNL